MPEAGSIYIMKKWIQTLAVLVLPAVAIAAGVPEPVSRHIETPVQVGETRLTFWIWDVYDVSLYAADGQYDPSRPFALRLHYLRKLKGKAIAERSIEEMRAQGISEVKLAGWFTQLEKVFPDVEKGTELIGIFAPGRSTRFYKDGEFIGQVLDPEFGMPFSNIWLGEQSSIPSVREELFKADLD